VCAKILEKKIFENVGYFFWPGARGVWPDIERARIFPYNLNVGYCSEDGVVSVCKKNQNFLYNFSRYEFLPVKARKLPGKR
jgi:hypothetical protein